MKSVRISFGGCSVEIAHEGSLAVRALDFLFGDLPAAASMEPHLIFNLSPGETGDQLRLAQEDT
jgi:hypothetical protein